MKGHHASLCESLMCGIHPSSIVLILLGVEEEGRPGADPSVGYEAGKSPDPRSITPNCMHLDYGRKPMQNHEDTNFIQKSWDLTVLKIKSWQRYFLSTWALFHRQAYANYWDRNPGNHFRRSSSFNKSLFDHVNAQHCVYFRLYGETPHSTAAGISVGTVLQSFASIQPQVCQ